MTWLETLERAIGTRLDGVPGRELSEAAAMLSARYRGGAQDSATGSSARGDTAASSAKRSPVPSGASSSSGGASRDGGRAASPRVTVKGPLWSDAERLAYLAVRAPATGAALRAVLRELQARRASIAAVQETAAVRVPAPLAAGNAGLPSLTDAAAAFEPAPELAGGPIRSLLDLGAGPGVGVWAALDQIDTLTSVTLVERDAASVALGQALARDAGMDDRLAISWRRADLRERLDVAPHDLVLLSYSIGELDEPAARAVVDEAWRLARVGVVIVEPGTPRHFARLLAHRLQLIEAGARIVAPCPHARACPMTAPDWCHFGARLGRTSLHRRLKQGALSYEDEKYSYIVALRDASAAPAPSRIVRRPAYHKGFVRLSLCGEEGLAVATVTKSQRGVYRHARDASWGDAWPPAVDAARDEPDEVGEETWPSPDAE